VSPVFDLDRYAALTVWAADWIVPRHQRAYPLELRHVPDVPVAVYIVFDCDDVVRYVGSVARRGSGLVSRLREHMEQRFESHLWTYIWVVELDASTPVAVVRWLEGVIGRQLRPVDNRRLPVAS
jgi:hypothetical protein